jgi:hypothetical protein
MTTTQDLTGGFLLNVLEVRYLRKAMRYRLGKRSTPPSGNNTSVIPSERKRELDSLADWILQEAK